MHEPDSSEALVGPDVAPSLGDAVRLVDREDRDATVLLVQPLDVHEAAFGHGQLVHPPVGLRGPELADALGDERGDLVLHQRDQRRHHEPRPTQHEWGDLHAQALADRRQLQAAERICTPSAASGPRTA